MSILSDEILTPVERKECERIGERLAPFYRVTDWRWGSRMRLANGTIVDDSHVPTAMEITSAIEDMAARAIKEGRSHPGYGVSSGGLVIIFTGQQADNNEGDPNDPDNHLRFSVRLQP